MNLSLRNKKAVVCGSTQGIGKAIAEELSRQGVNLTLIARDKEALGIAAVHYFYMRDYYLATGDNPTFFRYVDL